MHSKIAFDKSTPRLKSGLIYIAYKGDQKRGAENGTPMLTLCRVESLLSAIHQSQSRNHVGAGLISKVSKYGNPVWTFNF